MRSKSMHTDTGLLYDSDTQIKERGAHQAGQTRTIHSGYVTVNRWQQWMGGNQQFTQAHTQSTLSIYLQV